MTHLSAAVFVEDLESLIELLVTAWIGRLGDGPQVWEEIVQTDGLLLQLSLGHRLQLFATEKLEDVLVGGTLLGHKVLLVALSILVACLPYRSFTSERNKCMLH